MTIRSASLPPPGLLLIALIIFMIAPRAANAQDRSSNAQDRSSNARERSHKARELHSFVLSAGMPNGNWVWNRRVGPVGSDAKYIDYFPIDSALHLNAEWRGGFDAPPFNDTTWYTIDPYQVRNSGNARNLDYFIFSSPTTNSSAENVLRIRFELERHRHGADSAEYAAFYEEPGLVGRNVHDPWATTPAYLRTNKLNPDPDLNALQLHYGPAGVFTEQYWNPTFMSSYGGYDFSSHHGYQTYWWMQGSTSNRKLAIRLRARLDQPVSLTRADSAFSIRIRQKNDTASFTILDTTAFASQATFPHAGRDYDTVTFHAIAGSVEDSTFITLYWPGKARLTVDYLEFATDDLTITDTGKRLEQLGVWWPATSLADSTFAYSSDVRMEANDFHYMKRFIDSLVARYDGGMTYVTTNEEIPLGQTVPLKYEIRMLRDRSHGDLEYVTMVHDSSEQNAPPNGGFYRWGQPSTPTYLLEGTRLGWADTALTADPKVFELEPYIFNYTSPTPKRMPGDSLEYYRKACELMPESIWEDGTRGLGYYTPDRYLAEIQYNYMLYVQTNRWAKRVTSRNDSIGQRYWVAQRPGGDNFRTLAKRYPHYQAQSGWMRVPTGAEDKAAAHLAVSCGASGYYLWGALYGRPGDTTRVTENGGMARYDGSHASNFDSIYVRDPKHTDPPGTSATGYVPVWAGYAENFDTLANLLGRIREYGDALFRANYLADYTAQEAMTVYNAPFARGSLRARNAAGAIDSLTPQGLHRISPDYPKGLEPSGAFVYMDRNDSIWATGSNKTFVHVSIWTDTLTSHEHPDTLLYITNMRTDDSYDATGRPSLQDTRLISMQLKAAHTIREVGTPIGALQTPRVPAGGELRVRLLPGDGVLLRLGREPAR